MQIKLKLGLWYKQTGFTDIIFNWFSFAAWESLKVCGTGYVCGIEMHNFMIWLKFHPIGGGWGRGGGGRELCDYNTND